MVIPKTIKIKPNSWTGPWADLWAELAGSIHVALQLQHLKTQLFDMKPSILFFFFMSIVLISME